MKVPSGEGSLTGESSEDHQEPRFVAEAGFLLSRSIPTAAPI
jgi:hypothetical protein